MALLSSSSALIFFPRYTRSFTKTRAKMATTDVLLNLSNMNIDVHPLVLLSVQDHAARVTKGSKKRVVGMLLGQDKGERGVTVTNSFAVPFEEDDKDPRTWFLDHNYIESMNELFKKVNTREKLVGWYHTGPKLRASDLEINNVVKRYTPKPILVIVDVRPDEERVGGGIPTDAYIAVEEIKDDGTTTQTSFMHIPSSIEATEAEEIGVEHLLRDVKNLSVGTLSNKVDDQLFSLQGLHSRLLEIRGYLADVVNDKLPVNHQIIYNLQDIFNLLPNMDAAETAGEGKESSKRPFTVATNDQMLVTYLSSLIRAVIALHDLVVNKHENENGTEEDKEKEEAEKKKINEEEEKDKEDTRTGKEKAEAWFSAGKEEGSEKKK